jgi:hypothetical protein
VVALTYEAAPAFDPALAVRTGSRLGLSTGVIGRSGPRQSPWLAWAAIYDGPVSAPVVAPHDAPSITGWAADVSDDLFARRVDSILACIAAGDTYQVCVHRHRRLDTRVTLARAVL